MNSLSIIHENTITLEKNYYQVKSSIQEKLREWSDLYVFDDNKHQPELVARNPLELI